MMYKTGVHTNVHVHNKVLGCHDPHLYRATRGVTRLKVEMKVIEKLSFPDL